MTTQHSNIFVLHNVSLNYSMCIDHQLSSVVQSCPTLRDSMDCSTPGLPVHTNAWSLLKLMSIESVMPSNHPILCRPLLLLPSIFPSIRVFSIESVLHIRRPKYWSFSFHISPANDYSGLTSFRMVNTKLMFMKETKEKSQILQQTPNYEDKSFISEYVMWAYYNDNYLVVVSIKINPSL